MQAQLRKGVKDPEGPLSDLWFRRLISFWPLIPMEVVALMRKSS